MGFNFPVVLLKWLTMAMRVMPVGIDSSANPAGEPCLFNAFNRFDTCFCHHQIEGVPVFFPYDDKNLGLRTRKWKI